MAVGCVRRALGRHPASLNPSAPLPWKLLSTFSSRKPHFIKKVRTCTGSQVRWFGWRRGPGDESAAAGGVLGGVLGLPSQRGRLGGCSESALCMAASRTRCSAVKYRGDPLARRRTDGTALVASPFSSASLRAYCAGALDISQGPEALEPGTLRKRHDCVALSSALTFSERVELLEKQNLGLR